MLVNYTTSKFFSCFQNKLFYVQNCKPFSQSHNKEMSLHNLQVKELISPLLQHWQLPKPKVHHFLRKTFIRRVFHPQFLYLLTLKSVFPEEFYLTSICCLNVYIFMFSQCAGTWQHRPSRGWANFCHVSLSFLKTKCAFLNNFDLIFILLNSLDPNHTLVWVWAFCLQCSKIIWVISSLPAALPAQCLFFTFKGILFSSLSAIENGKNKFI